MDLEFTPEQVQKHINNCFDSWDICEKYSVMESLDEEQNLEYYEYYPYTCFLACRRKYKITEIPVIREYEKGKKIVTKIKTLKNYWLMLKPPLYQALGIKYKF